jgi:hypothetical protein
MDCYCSGQKLKDQIKNPKEVEKRIGRFGTVDVGDECARDAGVEERGRETCIKERAGRKCQGWIL